jgi:membrane protein DedA with SNARE-associated domain
VYAVLGLGAALENVFPPVPADTFALLGGFLAGRGSLSPWAAWGVTWLLNVASALLVYGAGSRYGKSFFEKGLGKHILHRDQMKRMRDFYERFGAFAIFFTRFLPGLRAVVPAFAGVSHQRLLPVAIPLAVASGIWYGALVWLGATAGRNLDTLMGWVDKVNLVLLGVALVLFGGIFAWWWRTRRGTQ